jgi:hypothetical protein
LASESLSRPEIHYPSGYCTSMAIAALVYHPTGSKLSPSPGRAWECKATILPNSALGKLAKQLQKLAHFQTIAAQYPDRWH